MLPAQTAPADEALTRRHAPRPIGHDYKVFRDCLRWEFGFTCAICLLHEHDIIQYGGAEGWGVMHVEHLVARSHDSRLVGIYVNVLLICRLCNGARCDAEQVNPQGFRLLDPTKDAWSKHFHVEDDRLIPFDGDGDALYTEDVYNINDARKVKLRRVRRERRELFLALLDAHRARTVQLVRRVTSADPSERATIAKDLAAARDETGKLCRLFNQGTWIPDDAPVSCRCGRASARTLPAPYLRQVVEIELP